MERLGGKININNHLLEEAKDNLLNTIYVPTKLKLLSEVLPKNTYDRQKKLENFNESPVVSPNIAANKTINIHESLNFIRQRNHSKNNMYELAPHHVKPYSLDKIYNTKEDIELKLIKEREFEENLKSNQRKERKERREKKRQKEAQEKKEIEDILLQKEDQKRKMKEKEERFLAEQLKNNLMDIKKSIDLSRKNEFGDDKPISIYESIDLNFGSKVKSNKNVGGEFMKNMPLPKKNDYQINGNKNMLGLEGKYEDFLKIDIMTKDISPINQNKNENLPYMLNISKPQNQKSSQNNNYMKNLGHYDLGNVYKPKVVERLVEGGSSFKINRKLSPIKRIVGK